MPHYYFDLCNGEGWLADPEGMELADEAAAHAEALSAVRSLIASEVRESATVNLAHFMTVRSEAGGEIYRLHYRDAVKFSDDPPEG